jgi:hypothetical protein
MHRLLAESLEIIQKASAVILAALEPKRNSRIRNRKMQWQSPASPHQPYERTVSGRPLSLSQPGTEKPAFIYARYRNDDADLGLDSHFTTYGATLLSIRRNSYCVRGN